MEVGQHPGHQGFDLPGADELVHGGHVHPQLVIVLQEGDHLADQVVDLFVDRGELVLDAPKIDGLDRRHELEGQDGIEVLHDGPALAGGGGAHAHVVLLVGGGGDAVHAGGMGVDLVLGHDGGRRVLADHVAGVEAAPGGQKGGQTVRKRGVHHALGSCRRR